MSNESTTLDRFEISSRFRKSLEERIARLERDATWDESILLQLKCEDHIRRHRRLVAVQRAEALRMRLFLDRTQARPTGPLISY